MFNRSRFALARKRRGMTKRALAELVGVTERSILAYENGGVCPENSTVSKIAQVLGFPDEFFFANDVAELSPDVASFRALTKMTAKQRDMALSSGNVALMLNQWIEEKFDLPEPLVPDMRSNASNHPTPDLGSEHDPESCAESLRKIWGLGELPIKNMIHLLESKGIRIFSLSIDAKEIDAFSMWYGGKPFIFLNRNKTSERCRFDAAHELGHLVMHKHGSPQGQDAEREANAFASGFLMPRKSVLANAPRAMTLQSLIAHKKYWTVSVAALNYRLHALKLMSDWTYRTLCVQIAQYGRDKEPDEAPFESSQVLTKVFSALRDEGISKNDISRLLMIPSQEINELTFGLTLVGAGTGKATSIPSAPRNAKLRLVKP